MSIACPNCNTRYIVTKEEIGLSGRKVKCSKCNHIWYQKLDYSSAKLSDFDKLEKNDVIAPIRDEFNPTKGINVPAVLPVKIPQNIDNFQYLWVSLIIVLSLLLFYDNFAIQSLFGNNVLSVKDISVENNKETGKMKVFYTVVNSSNYTIPMSLIRVRLLDKKQVIVKSYTTQKININLVPKQLVNMQMELDNVPYSAQQLDITLGNKLDFILN